MKYLFFFVWGFGAGMKLVTTIEAIAEGLKSKEFISVCGDIVAILASSCMFSVGVCSIFLGMQILYVLQVKRFVSNTPPFFSSKAPPWCFFKNTEGNPYHQKT